MSLLRQAAYSTAVQSVNSVKFYAISVATRELSWEKKGLCFSIPNSFPNSLFPRLSGCVSFCVGLIKKVDSWQTHWWCFTSLARSSLSRSPSLSLLFYFHFSAGCACVFACLSLSFSVCVQFTIRWFLWSLWYIRQLAPALSLSLTPFLSLYIHIYSCIYIVLCLVVSLCLLSHF